MHTQRPLILIDASHLVFHMYYVVYYMLKGMLDESSEPVDEGGKITDHPEFVQLFYAKLKTQVKRIVETFNSSFRNVVICKDCSKRKVWRKKIYTAYKERSHKSSTFDVGVFPVAYLDVIPKLMNDTKVVCMQHNEAEADDIIAVIHKFVRGRYPERQIVIVTNDNDYLQLADPFTFIVNLKNSNLQERSRFAVASYNATAYLRLKILMGDPSDNIMPVTDTMNNERALEIVHNKQLFRCLMADPAIREKYNHNRQLIDFNMIPSNLQNDIISSYKSAKTQQMLEFTTT